MIEYVHEGPLVLAVASSCPDTPEYREKLWAWAESLEGTYEELTLL